MDQNRVYPIDKEHTIMALEAGCRVYYVEQGSQDVYEFTRDDPLKELDLAEIIIAVKKG